MGIVNDEKAVAISLSVSAQRIDSNDRWGFALLLNAVHPDADERFQIRLQRR